MPDQPRQLPLDLPLEPRLGREDFLVGPSNRDAIDLIERWPDWPEPVLWLEGPAGAGKTHLAAIWSATSGAVQLEPAAIDQSAVSLAESGRPIVLEDLDRAAFDEHALFHLLNAARRASAAVLITSRTAPEQWRVTTPDLLSRLRLAPAVRVEAPDDALLHSLIAKLFRDRQISVETNVVDYLVRRIERSFAAASDIVARLDEDALSAGRSITRARAAQILQMLDDEED